MFGKGNAPMTPAAGRRDAPVAAAAWPPRWRSAAVRRHVGRRPRAPSTVGGRHADRASSSLLASTVSAAAQPFAASRRSARCRRRPRSAALEGLGLVVQPMRHVPLALVAGPVAADAGRRRSTARPTTSTPTSRSSCSTPRRPTRWARRSRAPPGFTGKGVTVAVVDSGCDASHPDLADHVVHNVKLYSAEYANVPPDASNRIVVANETGPYQNTDIGGGHGTHVAGIIAADSTTDPAGGPLRRGARREPRLLLDRRGPVHDRRRHRLRPHARPARPVGHRRGQQLVGQLVPPVRPARSRSRSSTKAVADLGVVVVFAAGNSGSEDAEMSLNPFSRGALGDLGRRRLARPPSRRLLVERPRLRQLAADPDRRRRAHLAGPATGSASTTPT